MKLPGYPGRVRVISYVVNFVKLWNQIIRLLASQAALNYVKEFRDLFSHTTAHYLELEILF